MREPEGIEDLEVLTAHQARTIEELSDEVRRQWTTIDRLEKAVRTLGERFQSLEDGAAPGPEITRPPHY